jgi:hypothetical protein
MNSEMRAKLDSIFYNKTKDEVQRLLADFTRLIENKFVPARSQFGYCILLSP